MKESRSSALEVSVESQRRRQILRAVIECVVEEGFEETTLRKVAARAGVSTGMLAYYYKTKRDLVNAAILEANRAFVERLDADTSGSFGLRRLELLLERSLASDESSALPKSFALQVRAAALNEPELRAQQYSWLQEGRAKVQRSVAAAIEAGQLRGDLDPEVAADLIYGLMIGWSTEMAVCPEAVSAEHVLAVCRSALALLSTQHGRSEQPSLSPRQYREPPARVRSGEPPATTPDLVTRELLADGRLTPEAASQLAAAFRNLYALAIGYRPESGDGRDGD